MTDVTRSELFDTVRPMLDGLGFTRARIAELDRLADRLNLPRALPEIVVEGHEQIGLTPADYRWAAEELGCEVAQIRAVDEVESRGGWFKDVRESILMVDGPGGFIDGPHLPKILFEAHHFHRYTDGKFDESHPNLSSPVWNRALYVGGEGEWTRLYHAVCLDAHAALMSASVGRYQIMGFNYALAGFDSVEHFWSAMKRNEREHLEAFVAFVQSRGLVGALRKISLIHAECVPFAKGYNGKRYAANQYHVKIARAYKKWRAEA